MVMCLCRLIEGEGAIDVASFLSSVNSREELSNCSIRSLLLLSALRFRLRKAGEGRVLDNHCLIDLADIDDVGLLPPLRLRLSPSGLSLMRREAENAFDIRDSSSMSMSSSFGMLKREGEDSTFIDSVTVEGGVEEEEGCWSSL